MAEDFELDLTEDPNINKTEERIKNLSSKVKDTAAERDAAKAATEAAEAARASAEKERDFYAGFADNVGKYPQASEHKDAIKEKVLQGYSVDDAIVSVLNKEGLLNAQSGPVSYGPVAGGSASTPIPGPKGPTDMSQEDRRAALLEMDKTGELAQALKSF
jgi:hypothetical protein